MNPQQDMGVLDFRAKANLGLAIACLLILGPFGVNNVIQGRLLLGIGSIAICAAMILIGWLTFIDSFLRRSWLLLLLGFLCFC